MDTAREIELYAMKKGQLIEMIDALEIQLDKLAGCYPAAILPHREEGCAASTMKFVHGDDTYSLAYYHYAEKEWRRYPDGEMVTVEYWWNLPSLEENHD